MDADQRTAWTRAIPRKDFAPTKYTVVCEKHFLTSDFVTTSTYRDEKTGRVLEVPLQLRRLKSGAIPSLFPNCPSYLSRPTTVVREGPEETRLRLEGESLQEAIRQSVEAHEEEKKKNNISTFEDLLTALTSFQTNTFWTKLVTHDKVLFLNFDSQEAPTVRFSVTVSADLIVKVFVGDVQLNKLGTLVLPVCLCDLREIDKVLTAVQSLAGNFSNSEERLQIVLKKTVETLDELASQSFPHEWQVEVVKFVKQQVGILLSRTSRYPADLLVFASLVFTISPHAYRFIRSTSKLKLPHPDTIRRVCGSYRVNPCSEQQDALFLSYAKRLAVGMNDHEKTVTLVMDEIHLQPYIDYKGGGLVTSYCLKELGFKYVLLGKFQSDCLEDRFGRYRQLSGAQYHISIRQMYEAEHKLRLQKVLELPESDEIPLCASTDEFRKQLLLADALSRIPDQDNIRPSEDEDVSVHAAQVLESLVSDKMKRKLQAETQQDEDLGLRGLEK
ncbi:uncharacterized protein LOC119449052 [Dermacentor silvarum]|uniref:uncharacterized protein LOC119449052 n=1 Tax=Dermacentor silvarum TaxID=543639 RepID=UPI002100ABF1|nr:uncharacterized protein LOC119449052 [Dermacentor silvarum]